MKHSKSTARAVIAALPFLLAAAQVHAQEIPSGNPSAPPSPNGGAAAQLSRMNPPSAPTSAPPAPVTSSVPPPAATRPAGMPGPAGATAGAMVSPGSGSSGTGWSPQKSISPPWNAGYQRTYVVKPRTYKPDMTFTPSVNYLDGVSKRGYDAQVARQGLRTRVFVGGVEY